MSSCASCGAPIIWRETPAGKAMPIDAEPVAGGNVLVEGQKCSVLGPIEIELNEGDLHFSHFTTCPDAAKHRRP